MQPLLPLALLSASLMAQGSFVTPAGQSTTEGAGASTVPFSTAAARLQQIDQTSRGTPVPGIRSIAFRRDGNIRVGNPRQVSLEVVMAEGDHRTFGGTFASNYLGTPTQVVSLRAMNLPDWNPPAGQPAPFDLVIPFDVPWNYPGVGDLLFELRVHTNSAAGFNYYTDRAATQYRLRTGVQNGTGCTTANRSRMHLSSYYRTSSTTIEIGFELNSTPANTPIVLALGTTDPQLSLPALCAPIRTDSLLVVPLAVSSPIGTVAPEFFVLPWNPHLAGASIFAQCSAIDTSQAGLPIALSGGNIGTIPDTQGGALVLAEHAYELTTPLATGASHRQSGGIVVRFGY